MSAEDRCAVVTLLLLFVVGTAFIANHPTTGPIEHGGTARAKAGIQREAVAELDQMLDKLLRFRPAGYGKCVNRTKRCSCSFSFSEYALNSGWHLFFF